MSTWWKYEPAKRPLYDAPGQRIRWWIPYLAWLVPFAWIAIPLFWLWLIFSWSLILR